jgi:hypothetical protein
MPRLPPLALLLLYCRAMGSRRDPRIFMADGRCGHHLRRTTRLWSHQEGKLLRSSDLLQPGFMAGASIASTKDGQGIGPASVETPSSVGAVSDRDTAPTIDVILPSQSLRLPLLPPLPLVVNLGSGRAFAPSPCSSSAASPCCASGTGDDAPS